MKNSTVEYVVVRKNKTGQIDIMLMKGKGNPVREGSNLSLFEMYRMIEEWRQSYKINHIEFNEYDWGNVSNIFLLAL